MTENEAKKNLEVLERFYRISKKGSALHEVLINFVTLEDLVEAIQALSEIQEYRAIGTIEELQALKEKNEPKKPIEIDTWGKYYKCPTCNEYAEDDLGYRFKCCPNCGTEFDWK